MKRTTFLIFLCFFLTNACFAEDVKKADLAGSWYPADPNKLEAMLNGYLNDAKPEKIPPNIIGLILPHAGYIYSGPIAAYGFKAVSGMDIDTVVVAGFSHRKYFDGISVYDRGEFETPLGPLPVDRELAKSIILSNDKLYFNPDVFDDENSVEMIMPFIRHAFKERDLKIVPIAMGVQSYGNASILGEALYESLKDRENVLIIASTDMSHYHNYGEANAIDAGAIESLKKMDPKAFLDKAALNKCEACGSGAVAAIMIASKKLGADSMEVLKYANSGDITGQKNRVVGYLSAAFYKSAIQTEEVKDMLNEKQKKRLLEIARQTIEAYVSGKKRLEVKEDDPLLNKEMGAFVTLHKAGQLRGCIGNIIGRGPLYLTVRDMAIESAANDPRFSHVTSSELSEIDIEISVLSEPEQTTDPDGIVLGKHGVIVKKGFRSGVYLPQVATETGWSKEQFLSSLCSQKAGLPPDAWNTGEAEMYLFTAEVFGEKDH
jgi:AmmeMemoRadiSam system protein B/AmmeMemoRadiSam system protein A